MVVTWTLLTLWKIGALPLLNKKTFDYIFTIVAIAEGLAYLSLLFYAILSTFRSPCP